MKETYMLEVPGGGEILIKAAVPETIPPQPRGIILAHGMHNDLDFPLLKIMADHLVSLGWIVVRFNFPYRQAGLDRPDRPEDLVSCLRQVVDNTLTRWSLSPDRLLVGGKSLGAATSAAAAGQGAIAPPGVVYLGFPLHQPRKPERSRERVLKAVSVPQLFVEGTRDPFCQPERLKQILAELTAPVEVFSVQDADHGFFPPEGSTRTVDQIYTEIAHKVGQWCGELLDKAS